MISGKAKELFLKWFREEKQLTGFEDKPILTKIFALSEWLKLNGYSISTKSSYYNSDYSATISFNQGDIQTNGHESLEKALLKAVEIGIFEFNDRFSETDG
jgi:hypothetical protein